MLSFFKAIGTAIIKYAIANPIQFAFQAVTAITGVKGFLQARQMISKGQDIMANKTAAGGKIPVIYGTRRVGAQIVYMDTAQNRSRDLFVVYAISVGE
jgi:predicted phage tail protein